MLQWISCQNQEYRRPLKVFVRRQAKTIRFRQRRRASLVFLHRSHITIYVTHHRVMLISGLEYRDLWPCSLPKQLLKPVPVIAWGGWMLQKLSGLFFYDYSPVIVWNDLTYATTTPKRIRAKLIGAWFSKLSILRSTQKFMLQITHYGRFRARAWGG